MSGRGGKRPGAGRKKGCLTKRTRKVAEALQLTGETPLEVLNAVMLYHFAEAETERRKGVKADPAKIAASFDAARLAARDAAPYTHARLAAVEHMGKGGGLIGVEVTDARERLARLVTGQTAADEVGRGAGKPH